MCDLKDYTVHGILQARILEWVAFPFSRGSSHPRTEPRSPALQADSLPTELLGKRHRLSQFLKMALNHCFLYKCVCVCFCLFVFNKMLTNGKFQKGRTFFSWAIKHMECLHFQKKKKN